MKKVRFNVNVTVTGNEYSPGDEGELTETQFGIFRSTGPMPHIIDLTTEKPKRVNKPRKTKKQDNDTE
jgi:hypothetical protein